MGFRGESRQWGDGQRTHTGAPVQFHREGVSQGMDRAILERHLAQAEEQVILDVAHVSRQTETVAELERRRQDASAARELLADLHGRGSSGSLEGCTAWRRAALGTLDH